VDSVAFDAAPQQRWKKWNFSRSLAKNPTNSAIFLA
jgi:hypothetical protein